MGVWWWTWRLAGLGGWAGLLLVQALALCCKKKPGNSKAGKGKSVMGKAEGKEKKGEGGEVQLEEEEEKKKAKAEKADPNDPNFETLKGVETEGALPKDADGPQMGPGKAPAPPPASPAPEDPAPAKNKKMASYQDKNYMTLAGLEEKNEELLPEDKQEPAGNGNAQDQNQFKVDDRIKKGRHIGAGNQNYMTLAGLANEDELLPKDDEDGAKCANGNFKVDDRIKKGRHVGAGNQNYMTLAGLQGDDELLPKDDDGKPKGDGWKPSDFKGPFKVDDRIKKGRHVGAGNQNYMTLAGLNDAEDELLPKDDAGGGGGKAPAKGAGNFNVDDRIKQGKKAPTKDPNYMTLAGLADDDELLPQDSPAAGAGKAKGPKGGKFKVDDRIKQGKKAPTKDPNYMTLAGLGADDELLPKDSPAARPQPQGGKGGKFKVDDRIKQGKKAPTKDPNYMTLAGLADNDQLLPKDR